MKKVAVIGSHGVGKTVLCRNIAAYEEFNTCRDVAIIPETVRDCPFPINDNSSIDGGYWIVCEQIAREQKAKSRNPDYIICDRSAIDPVLYMLASSFPSGQFSDLKTFASNWMRTYDKIIYIRANPSLEIIDDGFRATDPIFQKKVDEEFKKYLSELHTEYLTDILTIDSLDLMKRDFIGTYFKIINYVLED